MVSQVGTNRLFLVSEVRCYTLGLIRVKVAVNLSMFAALRMDNLCVALRRLSWDHLSVPVMESSQHESYVSIGEDQSVEYWVPFL